LGLAIEGGGMRGCVSAGMAAAIMGIGGMDAVDAVYGSSAGSLVSGSAYTYIHSK
jgi:predicted patatin/cPLA2 family phospholipase